MTVPVCSFVQRVFNGVNHRLNDELQSESSLISRLNFKVGAGSEVAAARCCRGFRDRESFSKKRRLLVLINNILTVLTRFAVLLITELKANVNI